MRALACFVLVFVGLSSPSQAATNECRGRIMHLGALQGGLTAEQLDQSRVVIENLQKNGLLYSALAATLQAQGITPRNTETWAAFVADFYMVPQRDAIIAETTSRLLYEFFQPQTKTLEQAVAASKAIGMGAQLFLETQATLRTLLPTVRWKDLVELKIFSDFPLVIEELAARMRRLFPRASVPLLAGFPPNLDEVLNSYAVLPAEVVTFDAQWRLDCEDAKQVDAVIEKLRGASLQELPVMRQAEDRAKYFRELSWAQHKQRQFVAQQDLARSVSQRIEQVDEEAKQRDAAAALKALTGIQARAAGLRERRDTLLARASRQETQYARYQQLTNRDEEKTSAGVKTLREVAAARRKFLAARKEWRASTRPIVARPASQPQNLAVAVKVPIAEQLKRESIADVLYEDEIDPDKLHDAITQTSRRLSPEEFTELALFALNFLQTDEDVSYEDTDLVKVAQSVLKAAKTFDLTERQISTLRIQLKTVADRLSAPEDHEDDETIAYLRATHSLEWLLPSMIDRNPEEALSQEERILRKDNFLFEMGQLSKDQDDEVEAALNSLVRRRGISPEQLTRQLILWLAEANPETDEHRAELVNKLCTSLWSYQAGLSDEQIERLRNELKKFTENISDNDELAKVGGFLRNSNWDTLSKRFVVAQDEDLIPDAPAAVAAANGKPVGPEVLPNEIQALHDRWRALAEASRPLREDSAVMAAYNREKQIRADLRAALATLDKGDPSSAINSVMLTLRSAHTALSIDRFTALVVDLAIVHTFKNKLSPDDENSETQYIEELFGMLRRLGLGSAQAARIAEASLHILRILDDEETELLYEKSRQTLLSSAFDLLFTRPNALESGDSERVQSALRKLIEVRNQPDNTPDYQLSIYLASPRWVSAATGYRQATLSNLSEVETELAQAEVDLQRARAAVEAIGNAP